MATNKDWAGGMKNGRSTSENKVNGHFDRGSEQDPHSDEPKLFEPIAIIGMGMRLPGGVNNATDFWDFLVNCRSGQCRVPKDRYNVDTWYGPGKVSHVASKLGYFLDHINPAHVDPNFWSFTKQEAELMDPQQRLFLEVVHEAFENAGATGLRGKDVGMYVGTMGEDWKDMEIQDGQHLNPIRADVFGDYVIANRASYEFDLKGPSMVVRTACSSSLVALHMACQDLHSGNCTSAIVGGVNMILAPLSTVVETENGVLSPSGSCKSFDANADGYARGEAVSAIYVKNLSSAIRDRDPIRAIIKSTCLGSDGKTPGLTVPNPEAHENLMRKAYRLAGIFDLSKTAMVECHGTGTVVGDPLEAHAVANVWGKDGIYIGSVKPNIGHSEGASGLSSIIKMVLALENSTIPPNILFRSPNPKIPWGKARLEVPTRAVPWPKDRLERVSINSFGIGGTNAHVILDSAASFGVVRPRTVRSTNDSRSRHLLVFSAKHAKSLAKSAESIEKYLAKSPGRLLDVAHSLGVKREVQSHRAFCVTDGQSSFPLSEVAKPMEPPASLVWVFTGQGAQWPQMGKDLIEQHPLIRHRIDELDGILARLAHPPPWTLKSAILAPKGDSRLYEAEFSQPCLAAIQISLVDLLRSWTVTPDAIVGHSSGETAAAYASGALTAEEAFLLAYHRGQITPHLKTLHNGGMAAVGLGRDQIEAYLRPGVIIGCENSQSSVTLSGEKDVLQHIMADIQSQEPGVFVRALQVECGYHSPHMQAVKSNYEARIAGLIHAAQPRIPFYSSVTGSLHHDMSAAYWVRNLVSPVLFDTALRSLLVHAPSPTFVELGPHPALAGPTRQILQSLDRKASYIGTLVRNADSLSCALKAAGNLWLAGLPIDIGSVNLPGNLLTDLPTYPWNYDGNYWTESRLSRDWRLRKFDHHELLGNRILHTSDAAPGWRCNLRLVDVPWLQDHEYKGDVLFPASAYVSMAGEAMRQLTDSTDYTLRHVKFVSPLMLADDTIEIVTSLWPVEQTADVRSTWYTFTIASLRDEVWTRHVSGQCRSGSERDHAVPQIVPFPRKVPMPSFYRLLKKHELGYGPRFRGLSEASAHVSGNTAEGLVCSHCPESSFYSMHPTVIDASLHLCMVAACKGLERKVTTVSVPMHIEELYVISSGMPIHVLAEVKEEARNIYTSCVTGIDDGKVSLYVGGLRVAPLTKSTGVIDEDRHAGAILEWKPDVDFLNKTQLQQLLLGKEAGLPGFLGLLGHKNPTMRILEINAGAVDCTALTLSALRSEHGERLYTRYIYTDVSADALATVKQSIESFEATEAAVFDVTEDPASQGFDPSSFDLVIAYHAVGVIGDLNTTLKNVKKLLHPRGRLILHTTSQAGKSTEFAHVAGVVVDESNGRLRDSSESWVSIIGQAGFNIDAMIFEDGARSTVFTTPAAVHPPIVRTSILCHNSSHPLVSGVTKYLEKRGFELDFFILGEDLPSGQPTACLLDLEAPFLHSITPDLFAAYKKSVLSLQDSSMLWVTGASQIECKGPNSSLILGALRSIRRETSTDLVTLELQSFDTQSWGAVADVLATFGERGSSITNGTDQDSEYVFHDGLVRIGRFHWVRVSEELEATPERTEIFFRPDRAYVLVGGLGGIGKSTAGFLVEKGARHLIFFSRSAKMFAESNPDYILELEAQGCAVQIVSGSVSNLEDVLKMVESANLPIAGVLNAAMVLDDSAINDMTFLQWQAVVEPKVRGTWNLHNALLSQSEPLDFFFLFSSLSGLGGLVGQANYGAANTFLDAFVQYRHSIGLAASVLDIGVVEGVGVLAREAQRYKALRASSLHSLGEQDLLDALELMIHRSKSAPKQSSNGNLLTRPYVSSGQVAIGMGGKGASMASWGRDPRAQFHKDKRNVDDAGAGPQSTNSLKEFLQSCNSDPELLGTDKSTLFLAREISKALFALLMRDEEEMGENVNLAVPLERIGVDSLVSIELRNWIRQKVGISLTAMEIRKAASLAALGRLTGHRLAQQHRA